MTRLIDADALKENFCEGAFTTRGVRETIDNAPTVPLPDFKEGYKQAILDGKTNFSKTKDECPFYDCLLGRCRRIDKQ